MEVMLLISIVTIAVVVIIAAVVVRKFSNGGVDRNVLLQENDSLKRTIVERDSRIEAQNQEISRLVSERDVQRTVAEGLGQQLAARTEEYKEQLAALSATCDERVRVAKEEAQRVLEHQVSELKSSYEQQLRQIKESSEHLLEQVREMNKAQVEGQLKLIQEQMQTTSERVLKSRQEELDARNMESVSKIVDPLRDSLKRMNEALDSTKREHQESLTRLDATIRENMRQSSELEQTAERLANALTGEVKVQGNFGEMRLRKLLEDMGLEDGVHYTTQKALKDQYGSRIKSDEDKGLIPDFILHFPNNRDVIVDSKVVLTDYERYMNSADVDEKSKYLAAHIKALRSQVDLLHKKDYTFYLNSNYAKLDFVIMYVFHESALSLALMNDTSLWSYAYNKNVLIMGPQTMYMNLRVLELMWVQMRQLTKQDEIIAQANLIVERTQLFASRLAATEKSMQKVLDDFRDLKVSTADGGRSIITSAKKLILLGAKQQKGKDKADLTQIFVDDDKSLLFEKSEVMGGDDIVNQSDMESNGDSED